MAIGDFGLLSKFISFAISHVKKYLLSNISRKHATTKLSFIFGKIRLNESEIRRFLFKNVTADTLPSYKTEPSVYTVRSTHRRIPPLCPVVMRAARAPVRGSPDRVPWCAHPPVPRGAVPLPCPVVCAPPVPRCAAPRVGSRGVRTRPQPRGPVPLR